jgi:N-acetylmuramoyl-L-alanine amidase
LRLFSLVFMAVLLVRPSPAHAFSVDNVRLGSHEGRVRMVVELSAVSDFRVFVLSDPYRIVVDLPEYQWNAGDLKPDNRAGIRAIRQGRLEPGINRIVFDMNAPSAVDNAFILQRGQGRPDRLVVDFGPIPASSFAAAKGRIFGGLTAGAPKPLASREIIVLPPPSESVASINPAAGNSLVIPPRKPAVPEQSGTPVLKSARKPLIVLDPGHGGNDPGAVGSGTREKNVVLALAKELKKQLEDSGQYRVMLTRENDTYIRLSSRVAFARKHGADLFVSIHADSIKDSHVRGASVYTLSEKASDAQTEMLADRENRSDIIAGVDLSVEDEEVASILVDLAMRDTMNQSKFFANLLVDTMENGDLRVLENPHRYAGFAVLKAPDIPSILVEAGFMSNPKEAGMLGTPDHRRKVAGAIKSGITAYFEHVRRNDRS